jgi:hypothetical protein
LVSAELVLTRGLDIDRFETAARKKLDEFTSPTTNRHAHDVGLAFAHHLVEQVLVQIRARAELKNGWHQANTPPPILPYLRRPFQSF